jgi:hypothetical protein
MGEGLVASIATHFVHPTRAWRFSLAFAKYTQVYDNACDEHEWNVRYPRSFRS